MYRVDTKPRNRHRMNPNFSRKRRLQAKGTRFMRLLQNRSTYDGETNTLTYYHATKGWRRRYLTPQLSHQLLGS